MSEEILMSLRNGAQYIKLQPNDKYGGAVELDNLIAVLNSVQSSFNSFIEAQFLRSYTQSASDKFKRELSYIKEETKLLIVDLDFNSYDTALCPDLVVNRINPSYLHIGKWKKDKFKEYKSEAFNPNYNSPDFINHIIKEYTPEERIRIFKPIIDNLQNNKNYTVYYGDHKKKYEHKFTRLKEETKSIILSNAEDKTKPVEEKYTQLARVEVTAGKVRPKVLELFDKKYNRVEFAPEVIMYGKKVYELRFPLLCTMDIVSDEVVIENQMLGIYAVGKTDDEAELMFSEEFDYIYTRYNELADDKLTDDVKAIKSYINHIVKR